MSANNEQQKKLPLWAIITAMVVFAAIAVVIVLLVVDGSNAKKDPTETQTTAVQTTGDIGLNSEEPEDQPETKEPASPEATEPTTTEPEATEPKKPELEGYGMNTTLALDNYSVLEASPNDENMSQVIAVNDNGDACLTNGQMQIYYWIEFYNFMNSYGDYAAMMGLDGSKPLYEQPSMQEGSTWEQYFLEAAAKNYGENYALAQAAIANGYTISEEESMNIEDMDDPNGEFAAEAKEFGYDSVEAYLQANFGKGISIADYQNYLRTYYAASNYYLSQKDTMEAAISEADVIAHYDKNADVFAEQGLTKVNNIAARHILIGVEGETDENGEYSAEAWAAAEKQADELYAEWKKNPTEKNFSEMAQKHTTDPGSKETGGLYDDVYPGQMVPEFNDWCFDGSRAEGDHGIVKTSYGYHIMYFVGQNENRKWYDSALEDMMGVQLNAMLDECVEKYPLKYDYMKVRLYDMVTNSISQTAE